MPNPLSPKDTSSSQPFFPPREPFATTAKAQQSTSTQIPGPKRASQHPNTARVSAQNLSKLAKQLGRCGDINEITGYVCVTQPHEDHLEHMAIQIGGPNDGKIYSTWGGVKAQT